MEGFGERLRLARVSKGIKQGELASSLGMNQSAVSAYEHDTNEPSLGNVVLLAKTLEVSTDWLLGLEESKDVGYGLNETQRLRIRHAVMESLRTLADEMEDEIGCDNR